MRTFEVKGLTTERGAQPSALVKCAKTTTLRHVLTGAAAVLCAATVALGGGVAAVQAANETNNDLSGVKVSLFDYWDSTRAMGEAYDNEHENVNYATGGSRNNEKNARFEFGTIGRDDSYDWNKDQKANVTQGLMENTLKDGKYPVFSDTVIPSENYRGETDAEYLFTESDYAKAFPNVTGLFTNQGGNRYSFDSSKNFAQFDKFTGKISLLDAFMPATPDADGQVGIGSDKRKVPQFLPFNTLQDMNEGYQEYLNTNGATRHFARANYAFGMMIEADFRQPKNGQVASDKEGQTEDMVFNFSGDDDVWVYIDGALVLDIGGIHSAMGGSINFATGVVKVDGKSDTTLEAMMRAALGDKWVNDNMVDGPRGSKIFKDYSNHKLKFFYLERGHGASNCKIEFNLETVPEGNIDIYKQIKDSNTDDFSSAQFKVRVDIAQTEDGSKPATDSDFKSFVGTYQLYDSATHKPIDGKILNTNEDGTFMLGNGQYARLLNWSNGGPINATDWYKVTELAATGYDENDYEINVGDATITTGKGVIGKTDAISVDENPSATIENYYKAADKYAFEVEKVMANGQQAPAGATFKMLVTNEKGEAYKGTYYLSDENGNFTINDSHKHETTDGVIELSAGQSAKIMNVAPGTTFVVKEILSETNKAIYNDPKYSPEGGTVKVDNTSPNSTGVVTVTNSLKVQPVSTAGALNINKQLNGRKLDASMFDFTVEGIDEGAGDSATTKAEAEKKLTDSGINVTFTNRYEAAAGVSSLVLSPELSFSEEDVGKTYGYLYKEKTGALHNGYQDADASAFTFDSSMYKVTYAVAYVDGTGNSKLQVRMTVYKQNDEKWDPQGNPLVVTGGEVKEPLAITFVNEYKPLGLQITKKAEKKDESEKDKLLEGAFFTLYLDTNNDSKLGDGDSIADGIFSNADLTGEKLTETGFGTDKNGLVHFYGLKDDAQYIVVETKAPAGYQLAANSVLKIENGKFLLQGANGDFEEVNVSPEDGRLALITISDKENPTLPMTGSSGSVGLGAAGVATIAVAGCWLLRRRGFDFGKLIGR